MMHHDSPTSLHTKLLNIGLDCPSKSLRSAYLTLSTDDYAEQFLVTAEELQWLRDVGIPAWLQEITPVLLPLNTRSSNEQEGSQAGTRT